MREIDEIAGALRRKHGYEQAYLRWKGQHFLENAGVALIPDTFRFSRSRGSIIYAEDHIEHVAPTAVATGRIAAGRVD